VRISSNSRRDDTAGTADQGERPKARSGCNRGSLDLSFKQAAENPEGGVAQISPERRKTTFVSWNENSVMVHIPPHFVPPSSQPCRLKMRHEPLYFRDMLVDKYAAEIDKLNLKSDQVSSPRDSRQLAMIRVRELREEIPTEPRLQLPGRWSATCWRSNADNRISFRPRLHKDLLLGKSKTSGSIEA
jgi:hypothetical protein